jgi:hypothetical protein
MNIGDIVLEIYSLTDSDSTSYPDATMLRRMNAAYEKIIGKIMCQDGNWEFDDTNFTDFPRGKTTMVAGQHDYTFDTAHLAIESCQVMDNAGIWHTLTPISKDRMGVPEEEFEKTDGLPKYYDKDGSSVLIYPAPAAANVTLVAGLQVHFRRTADIFTAAQVTTGTKIPGFASPYHMIIALDASIPYCMSYKKDRVPLYEKKLAEMTEDCLKFYAKREKDVRNIMENKGISFR